MKDGSGMFLQSVGNNLQDYTVTELPNVGTNIIIYNQSRKYKSNYVCSVSKLKNLSWHLYYRAALTHFLSRH
jgi:hypothetical protein